MNRDEFDGILCLTQGYSNCWISWREDELTTNRNWL